MNDIYLITGATGFIGANIVRRLVSENKNVHVVTRNKKLNWRLSDLASKIKIHEVDLLDKNLNKIVAKIKPDYVFHLAVYGSLPREDNIDELIDVNIRGTINLINAVKQNKFKLFINTGSSSEYGTKDKPMAETDLPFPVNDYGVTKLAVTAYVTKEAVRNNLPFITFRLFSVYGPYEESKRLIPDVILSAINNKQISIGDPKHVRDFIFIDDVVDAYLKACKMKINPGDIFNIGTGKQFSVGSLVETVVQLSNSKAGVKYNIIKKQERQVEPKVWKADIKKSKKILKWQAKYSLNQGIASTIAWFVVNNKLYE